MKTTLTIAGSDSSGGAGIQADLKTFTTLGVYGMSVLTAITAQNTCGVRAVHDIPAPIVAEQLDAVFEDIPPDAVKIGMVYLPEIIETIASKLQQYRPPHIVMDPVMVSTSGCSLMADSALAAMRRHLFPLAELLTPNMAEARVLAGMEAELQTKADMLVAAEQIAQHFDGAILVKGGHLADCSDDLLYQQGKTTWFPGKRRETPNTHGTGCTLSSAIAAYLAKGLSLEKAIDKGKAYLTSTLSTDLALGHGNGPLNHCWNIQA